MINKTEYGSYLTLIFLEPDESTVALRVVTVRRLKNGGSVKMEFLNFINVDSSEQFLNLLWIIK